MIVIRKTNLTMMEQISYQAVFLSQCLCLPGILVGRRVGRGGVIHREDMDDWCTQECASCEGTTEHCEGNWELSVGLRP
jgi:hypothetical protein